MNSTGTYIIAEAGVNHNKNVDTAIALADAAKETGADVVKYQLELPNVRTPYTLTWDEQLVVYEHCKKIGMPFACTAFDVRTLYFLVQNTKLEFIKIASCDATNTGLIKEAEKCNIPIIQSVKRDARIVSFGAPRKILHVVAEYPTPPEHSDLKRVTEPGISGISDHSGNIAIPIAAAALGAKIIECHITFDRNQPGPDHRSSLTVREFRKMVKSVRDIEKALA